MKTHYIAVIQARKDSKRLPEKIFAPLNGIPLLGIIIANLQRVTGLEQIWVATSEPGADQVCELAAQYGAQCYVGDSHNVLSRYIAIARQTGATHIIRATGDNPFVPPENPQQVMALHSQTQADVAAYINLPLGMAVESLSVRALLQSYEYIQMLSPEEQAPHLEHVSTFMKRNQRIFHIAHQHWPEPLPVDWPENMRLTIDEPDDLQLAEQLALYLVRQGQWPHFSLDHVLRALDQNPHWRGLNRHVNQRPAHHSELPAAYSCSTTYSP